ncbi:hypothetical protein RRG08_012949 [Elysia crispata]|uniref:Uncharacterized protein n=1 Tax=Elysia crispata TaxID=231223 RepID=A0AAE1A061_9GAST|nr:hypothetical protein RRG08_012949 [Elysia crispata]
MNVTFRVRQCLGTAIMARLISCDSHPTDKPAGSYIQPTQGMATSHDNLHRMRFPARIPFSKLFLNDCVISFCKAALHTGSWQIIICSKMVTAHIM